MGWQHRVLASPVPLDAMVALRLNAVVVDLAVLGPQGWTYLDKLCARLPGLGVIVCTGQSSVAQRVRGLRLGADDWVTKPCHPEELIARIEAVVRRRKRADVRVEKGPVVIGEVEIRADQFQAFVGGRLGRARPAASSSSSSCWPRPRARSCSARRSTSACGATRWSTATAPSTSSCASCAPSSSGVSPYVALHPHPLRHRLPLLGRAGRGAASARVLPRRRSRAGRAAPSTPRAGAPAAPAARSSSPRTRVEVRDGSDRNKNIRNVAIILALAVAVWKLPGGGTAAATISNIFSVLFLGGLFFLGYRALHGAPRDALRPRGAPARAAVRRAGAGRVRVRRHQPHVGRRASSAACSGSRCSAPPAGRSTASGARTARTDARGCLPPRGARRVALRSSRTSAS